MKRVQKFNLNELSQYLTVLDRYEQREIIGGGNGSRDYPYTVMEYLSLAASNNWPGGWVYSSGGYVTYVGKYDNCYGQYVNNPYLSGTSNPSAYFIIYSSSTNYGYSSIGTYYTSSYTSGNVGYSYCGGYSSGDFSKEEKDFIISHPFVAYTFSNNANLAFEKTKGLEGQHNGYGDAVRHCFWSALNKKCYPNDNYAETFGDAHEKRPASDYREPYMDSYNNRVGFQLGLRAAREHWSNERLYQECINAANNGLLQTSLYQKVNL